MSTITQLSIFINNEPGSIANISRTLKEANINLKAFNIAESSGFGVFRAIADSPADACAKLRRLNIIVKLTDVIAVPMDDHPGSIYDVSKVFGDADINIEYAYAYAGPKGAAVFFRVDDTSAAEAALSAAGMKTLSEDEI